MRRTICLLLVLAVSACMPAPIRQQQAQAEQLRTDPAISTRQVEHADGVLNYAHSGLAVDASKVIIVFVHGTPGRWENAGAYLQDDLLRSSAALISVDRPGWGDSLSAVDTSTFAEQSKQISVLLGHLKAQTINGPNEQKLILAGHSLGASIAPRVAVDSPELVDGLLLMSGTLNPDLGGPRWFNRLAAIPGVYCVLPEALLNSNREIMQLKGSLQEMQPLWPEVNVPVTVMQGMQDGLVYPANIEFAEHMLASSTSRFVRLPGAGHLVNLEYHDDVREELLALIARVAEPL